MTQFPGPNNPYNPAVPLPYAQSYAPPKLRPTSVTVMAILGIILAAITLLGSLCNTLQLSGMSMGPDASFIKGIQDDHVLFAWSIVGTVVNLAVGGLLLAGSIGALSLKRLARLWLIAYSWADIGFTLLATGIGVAVVMPRTQRIVQNAGLNTTIQSTVEITMWAQFLLSLLLLVFPALMLYFMSRPHVKEAFQRGMVAPPW
jgi:hypothetical protein